MAEVFPNLVKTTKPGNPKNVKQKKGEGSKIGEFKASKEWFGNFRKKSGLTTMQR